MRFGYPADGTVLYDEDTTNAAAVIATLAFFGGVTVRQQNPTAVFPGN
jgi:hypothetical protein